MPEPEDLQKDPIAQRLRDWDPQSVAEVTEFRGERTLLVPRSHLRRAAELLAGDPEMGFNFLSDITAVDRYPVEPRFELNYHMVSLPRRDRLRVRVRVAGRDPVADSVTQVWPTANWQERERVDLFGIRFAGH